MSRLFRNRWFALLWMVTTIASASLFVSDEGGAAKLLDTAEQIRTQRQQLQHLQRSSVQLVEAEAEDAALPVLLPAGDLNADPHDPQPGDVFIDAVSGRRVRIVGRSSSAEPVTSDPH